MTLHTLLVAFLCDLHHQHEGSHVKTILDLFLEMTEDHHFNAKMKLYFN